MKKKKDITIKELNKSLKDTISKASKLENPQVKPDSRLNNLLEEDNKKDTKLTNVERGEINQRSENELIIPCNCGGYEHFICMHWEIDDWMRDFYLQFIDEAWHWIERIRRGFRFIFGKDNKIYFSELGFTRDDCIKMRDFLNKYLDELEKFEKHKTQKELKKKK